MTNENYDTAGLIETAQAFDSTAQAFDRQHYARRRRLAFTARKWARQKS